MQRPWKRFRVVQMVLLNTKACQMSFLLCCQCLLVWCSFAFFIQQIPKWKFRRSKMDNTGMVRWSAQHDFHAADFGRFPQTTRIVDVDTRSHIILWTNDAADVTTKFNLRKAIGKLKTKKKHEFGNAVKPLNDRINWAFLLLFFFLEMKKQSCSRGWLHDSKKKTIRLTIASVTRKQTANVSPL